MLKIVYPNCCGIDVHKTFVVAVIAITDDQGISQYYRRRFSTFTNQLKELKKWLDYYSCFHICMESTGKYRNTGSLSTISSNQTMIFVWPTQNMSRRFVERKQTKKDAQWIADLYKHDVVAGSFI